jgi:hypothetical protein
MHTHVNTLDATLGGMNARDGNGNNGVYGITTSSLQLDYMRMGQDMQAINKLHNGKIPGIFFINIRDTNPNLDCYDG